MHVRDLMTRNVHSCSPDQSASHAARAMWDFDIGSVPVVDPEWRPIGMITDRDICMCAYMQNRAPAQITIADAMSKEIYCCRESDTLATAERTMQQKQVRRLPVVDDAGVLVGMLSLNDIALHRTGSPLAKAKGRVFGDVTETLAAVSRHREPPMGVQM